MFFFFEMGLESKGARDVIVLEEVGIGTLPHRGNVPGGLLRAVGQLEQLLRNNLIKLIE